MADENKVHPYPNGEQDEEAPPGKEYPPLLSEMSEHRGTEWRETARWVKFEEMVEEGGNRWSKPFVSTLSLHSIFELRYQLLNGSVLLDVEGSTFAEIVDNCLEQLVALEKIDEPLSRRLTNIFQQPHTHQFQHKRMGGTLEQAGLGGTVMQSIRSGIKRIRNGSAEEPDAAVFNNLDFLKKLPRNVQGCNLYVGEVHRLDRQIAVFVRIKEPVILERLIEVPIPTKFLVFLLGSRGEGSMLRNVGRAMGTLLTDPVFKDLCYSASGKLDILNGLDEFLGEVTVLPRASWNPETRMEPPEVLPSIKQRFISRPSLSSPDGKFDPDQYAYMFPIEEEEEVEDFNDPILQRTGRFCGGLIADIKRKIPWYLSDYKDALNIQSFACALFMYFALITPIITFGAIMAEATEEKMATMESLVSGALCGVVYHLFAGQPLTIIGATGPIFAFEIVVYDSCKEFGLDYMSFRLWVNVWAAIILLALVAADASSMVRYITRFSEEGFATLIAIIFIYNALGKTYDILHYSQTITLDIDNVTSDTGQCLCAGGLTVYEKNFTTLIKIGEEHGIDFSSKPWFQNLSSYEFNVRNVSEWKNRASVNLSMLSVKECNLFHGDFEGDGCYQLYDVFLVSVLLMLGTFTIAIVLKSVKDARYFPTQLRGIVSDFAVVIAVLVMAGVNNLFDLNTPKLSIPSTIRPTSPERGWIIHPFNDNPIWTAFAAIPPAIFSVILIFVDQTITTVIVNRKDNKLKKGAGYHLDLFVIALLVLLTGILGLPICVAATVRSLNHVHSLRIQSESRVPGEKPTFIGVREQRLSGMIPFLLIGVSTFMADGLRYILCMPILYGVFLYMGITALSGLQMVDRLKLMFMPMKYQPDYKYLRNVPIRKVHLFTLIQTACLVLLWVLKEVKSTKIFFPIMLVVMMLVRKMMERFFTEDDLYHLDDPMPDISCCRKLLGKKSEPPELELNPPTRKLTMSTIEDHLEIDMGTGHVMNIPLETLSKLSTAGVQRSKENISEPSKLKQIPEAEPLLGEKME